MCNTCYHGYQLTLHGFKLTDQGVFFLMERFNSSYDIKNPWSEPVMSMKSLHKTMWFHITDQTLQEQSSFRQTQKGKVWKDRSSLVHSLTVKVQQGVIIIVL